jgi:arylsulfatase A-like enzyme
MKKINRRYFMPMIVMATAVARLSCATAEPVLAKPVPTQRPNILFAIADDWSYGHAGAYGCRWVKTPAFDRVAKDGILFANAYTPTGKCSPSRASILTGRNPWQLKAAANHSPVFPPEFKTYAEALGGHGYFVGMTGKGWAPGVAKDQHGQPRQMAGQPFDKRTAPPPTPQTSKGDYAGNFEEFLDAAPKNQPWCFWYGGREPHRGYEYGSGVAKGGKKTSDIDRVPGCWPDNETVRNDMLDYAFEIEFFDRHLGRMLAVLEKRGLLANTLVVVTSDNGMPFPHDKGYAYNNSDHLPLAIMWPSKIQKPGRVVEDYVSFIDFAPTFIEVAGLKWEQTGMAPATGRSLTGLFDGKSDPQRDHVLVGKERNDVCRPGGVGYPIRGIAKNGMLYLHNFEPDRWPAGDPKGYGDADDGPTKSEVIQTRDIPGQKHFWEVCFGKIPADQLFDLRRDPDCLTNLAASVDFQPYQRQLFEELKSQSDPRLIGPKDFFDQFPNTKHPGPFKKERKP